MRTLLFAVSLLACLVLAAPAYPNGDPVYYNPNTGVIDPGEPTPAQVERERLDIEFQPSPGQEVRGDDVRFTRVRAEYWITNPTDQPLDVKIGFPVPDKAVDLVEAPVRLDGQPIEWRLLDYEQMLRPLQPGLIEAMRRWAGRHSRLVELAGWLRQTDEAGSSKHAEQEALTGQFQAECKKAGLPVGPIDLHWTLYSSREAAREYKSLDTLRKALLVTGQRKLLPEGRWQVDETVLSPTTGRPVVPEYPAPYESALSLLTFSLHLEPNGHHRLLVKYTQQSGVDYGEGVEYDFNYIIKTVSGWASFGPIEATIKAPPGLVFRSLPSLPYLGMSHGLRTYSGTIAKPDRNLQIVLANKELLHPRLMVNGQDLGRWDMRTRSGALIVPLRPLDRCLPSPEQVKVEKGYATLTRQGIFVLAKVGAKQMLVNNRPVALSAPVVVRTSKDATCVPVEVLKALYPDYEVALSYHAPSNSVLLNVKPKPAPAKHLGPTAQPPASPRGPRGPRGPTAGPASSRTGAPRRASSRSR